MRLAPHQAMSDHSSIEGLWVAGAPLGGCADRLYLSRWSPLLEDLFLGLL